VIRNAPADSAPPPGAAPAPTAADTAPAASGSGSFRVGEKVEGLYQGAGGGTEWYAGTVSALSADGSGSFSIDYADGDHEDAVAAEFIRRQGGGGGGGADGRPPGLDLDAAASAYYQKTAPGRGAGGGKKAGRRISIPEKGQTPKKEFGFSQFDPATEMVELATHEQGKRAGPPLMPRSAQPGRPENIVLNSSDAGKYKLGMMVNGLGPKHDLQGWVVKLTANDGRSTGDETRGAGEVEVWPNLLPEDMAMPTGSTTNIDEDDEEEEEEEDEDGLMVFKPNASASPGGGDALDSLGFGYSSGSNPSTPTSSASSRPGMSGGAGYSSSSASPNDGLDLDEIENMYDF
jgi:hypothetical protein